MYIIYFLTVLFSVCCGVSDAAFETLEEKYLRLNGAEPSLDYSEKYPKLECLTISFGPDWSEIVNYYLNQNNDLGISKNRNLYEINIYSTEIIPFFRNTYLPQVTYLNTYVYSSSSWDFLAAFPQLREFHGYAIPSFESFAMYNPHLREIDIFTPWFREFSSEELNGIAKLPELRNLKYCFNAAPANFKDIEKQLQALFPRVKIQLILNPQRDD